MELTRLYPAWWTGVLVSPQVALQTRVPHLVLRALRGGLLHRCFLSDLFGSDYPGGARRTQVTWVLWGYLLNKRYLVQTTVADHLVSTTLVWPSANWFERELWEMFGVRSEGHPDLRRLLTDYGFQGRPLRKDFPPGGYSEVRYSEKHKRVVMRPVFFTQEFRTFDFQSPWQS